MRKNVRKWVRKCHEILSMLVFEKIFWHLTLSWFILWHFCTKPKSFPDIIVIWPSHFPTFLYFVRKEIFNPRSGISGPRLVGQIELKIFTVRIRNFERKILNFAKLWKFDDFISQLVFELYYSGRPNPDLFFNKIK